MIRACTLQSKQDDMQVMGVNGVSHQTVTDDLDGATAVLKWLGTMPPVVGVPPCPLPSSDPVDRAIGYYPGPSKPHSRCCNS